MRHIVALMVLLLVASTASAWDFRDEVYTCGTGGMTLAELESGGVTLVSHIPCTREWMEEAGRYGIRGMPYISLYKVYDATAPDANPKAPFWGAVDMTRHPEWVYIGPDGQKERPFNNPFYPKCNWQSCTNTAGIADAYCRGAAEVIETGAGGVFIDNVLPAKVCYGPKFGIHQHLYPGQDNIYSFKIALGRVQKTIKGLGPDKAIMLNVGRWDLWQGFGDCLMLESFIYNVDVKPGPGGWVGKDIVRVKDWAQILKWIQETAPYVDGGGSIVTLEYLPADPEAAFYTYACAKLGNYLWSGTMPVRRDVIRTLYRCRMQRASGPLQEAGGVYFRAYPNGLAAVNTTEKEASVQAPAPHGCKELADVHETRRLPVRDGRVELKVPAQAGRLYIAPEQLAEGDLREALVALQTAEGDKAGADDSPLKSSVAMTREARQAVADAGLNGAEDHLVRLCQALAECEKVRAQEGGNERLAEGPRLSAEEVRKQVSTGAKDDAPTCEVAKDAVVLTSGGVRWELGRPKGLVTAGRLGANCGVSIDGLHPIHGWLAPEKIEGAKVLTDAPDSKVVEITLSLVGAKTKETIPGVRFALTAEARRGEPGLRLKSALRNTGDKDISCYMTWATKGAGTWCSGPGQAASRSEKDVPFGKGEWVYVHPSQSGGAGVLVITELPKSHGHFACNIFSEPRTGKLAPGQERRIDFDLYLVVGAWQDDPAALGAFGRAPVYASRACLLAAEAWAQVRLVGEARAGRKMRATMIGEGLDQIRPEGASLLDRNGSVSTESRAEVEDGAITWASPPSLHNDQYLQLIVRYSARTKAGKAVQLAETADVRPLPSLSLKGAEERPVWDGRGATAALVIANHMEREAACRLIIVAPEGYTPSDPGRIALAGGETRTVPVTITAAQAAPCPTGVRAALRFDPPGASGEQELPLSFAMSVKCPRFSKPPKIDGRLDDEAWKGAATAGPFVLVRTGSPPKEPTVALVGYDDKYLYVGFRCRESQMKALTAKAPRKPGVSNPDVHGDDSVEVFLSPGRNREYVQLAANSLGAQKASKPVPWEVACGATDKEWTVEMRIELAGLGARPKPGDTWAANFCRMEQRLKEASAWSPTQRGFHEPQSFGLLTFGQ